jgi:hypothetical protein
VPQGTSSGRATTQTEPAHWKWAIRRCPLRRRSIDGLVHSRQSRHLFEAHSARRYQSPVSLDTAFAKQNSNAESHCAFCSTDNRHLNPGKTNLLSPAVAPETPETMPKIAPSPSFTPEVAFHVGLPVAIECSVRTFPSLAPVNASMTIAPSLLVDGFPMPFAYGLHTEARQSVERQTRTVSTETKRPQLGCNRKLIRPHLMMGAPPRYGIAPITMVTDPPRSVSDSKEV